MRDILRIEDRNYTKEYGNNPWDTSHGTSIAPIVVNERKEESTPRQIIFGNSSYLNDTRGVRFNTTKFDVEIVPVFLSIPFFYYLVGICVKASDIDEFFMHMVDTDASTQWGPLTCDLVTPRVNLHDYQNHSYTETNYDPSQNPWLAAYTQLDLYKHYFHTFPLKYAFAARVATGSDVTANILITPPFALSYGYQYSWFNPTSATEDMFFIQAGGSPVFNPVQYTQISTYGSTANVAYSLYDGNSVDAICANADVIRGNTWAQAQTGQFRQPN